MAGLVRVVLRFDKFWHLPAAGRSVIVEGGFQMGDGAECFLVGEKVGTGDARPVCSGRGVINAHMQVLPAHATGVGRFGRLTDHWPVLSPVMRCPVRTNQPPELLDVEMNHVAKGITDIPLQGCRG